MFLKQCLKQIFLVFRLVFCSKRGGVPILMYHSIGENDVFFTVQPAVFEKQMQHLKDNNYCVMPLTDLVDRLRQEKLFPSKVVALTFDDGYADNYNNVFPILKKHNFPATIFLATGFIGRDLENSQGSALPLLNWRQIKEMHQSGLVDFEPHSLTHPKLNYCSPVQAKAEIGGSKGIIEKALNKKCTLFSYPKGRHNQEIIELVRQEGFSGAVTLEKGRVSQEDNPLMLKRCSVNSTTSFVQFRLYLSL